MTVNEYIKTHERYQIHGCKTTPTKDFLFDNWNIHLNDWLKVYGNYNIIHTYQEEDYFGWIVNIVFIDNTKDI